MTKNESTRVGFVLPPGFWLGGKNYLRNLFAAIQSLRDNSITPVIFTGMNQPGTPEDFPRIEVVASSIFDRKQPAWILRRVLDKTFSQDILLRRLLQRHNVTVLSHSLHLGRQKAIKTVGWIPDFQHVHLPEFFTQEERDYRQKEYFSICESCDKVLVSSECARTDLIAFAPGQASKVELLRFVASPVPIHDAASLAELQTLYNFNGPYFLLPNQFWAHKNHRVVISAVKLLKQQQAQIQVLATGSTEDYRNPSFFPSLLQYATECDVLDRFRILGQIPFNHLAGLMQHATAFINPSRFEGWSTSVEEAKSMGKQIVLSDIPVHREQAPGRSFFFPVDSPPALAEALIAAQTSFDSIEDVTLQNEARMSFPIRQQEYGETYRAITRRIGI